MPTERTMKNFLLSPTTADEVMELYLFLRAHIPNHTDSTYIPCTRGAKNLVILLFYFSDADLKALQYSENLKNWQNPQTWWKIQSSAVNGLGQRQRAPSCHPWKHATDLISTKLSVIVACILNFRFLWFWWNNSIQEDSHLGFCLEICNFQTGV